VVFWNSSFSVLFSNCSFSVVFFVVLLILLSNTKLIVKYYICFNVSRRMWFLHENRTAHKHDPF
jgi:hypothetical protein